jgi:hypothetical protein
MMVTLDARNVTRKNSSYLMHLVGYLYEEYHDVRSLEHKVTPLSIRFHDNPNSIFPVAYGN